MASLYDEAKQVAREEVLRLKAVYFSIISPEDLATSREKYEDLKPRAQMVVEWEPLSYRKEGGKRGNVEFDFYPVSFGLDNDAYESAREGKYRGVPTARRITIPRNHANANQPWQMFMLKAKEVGIDLEITDDGDFSSESVGQVYRVEAGFRTIPTYDPQKKRWTKPDNGEDGREVYMRLPVENVSATYVQPDDVPVRIVNASEDEGPSAAPVTATAGSGSGVTKEQLAAALGEAGIIGNVVANFATPAQQMRAVTEAGARAPILFLGEVQGEAAKGTLLDYAVAKGAIEIDGDLIRAAA